MQHYSPLEYLKIDVANQYGHDKKSFKQRISWFNSLNDPQSKVSLAEKPAQYLAACLAHEDALAGIPTGHLTGLDACASGIAILGILAGCHTTSKNCGVIGQKRMDMYGECTKEMNTLVIDIIEVPRNEVKDAQMPHFYGSKAQPKIIFGEETDELYAFYEAQETVAPGACHSMREFLGSWQSFALEHSHTCPDGYDSRVPVLTKMKTKLEIDELDHTTLTYIYEDNIGEEKGLAVAANMTHAVDGFLVREVTRRCYYDTEKLVAMAQLLHRHHGLNMPMKDFHPMELTAMNHGFISLRGIEFINEQNIYDYSSKYRAELLDLVDAVLDNPSFPVICIHDEFKAHPNNMNYLRETYRDILAELADSTVGQQIIREVRNDPTYVLDKISTDLGDEIMKAEYFLS
jgi:hypothetical protein